MRLLLVEEAKFGQNLAKQLRRHSYAVDVVADGESAIARVGVDDYDVFVLDTGLTDLDGIEVCRSLRALGVQAPVLMLTAHDAVETRIKGLDSGADACLSKPFAVPELIARLHALRRRGSRRPAVVERLTVGPLVLDTGARTCYFAGARLALTAREYALLELLARHAGQVVDRPTIARHVWDPFYDPMSNVIDVYVRRLRRTLARLGGDFLIKTRRELGYVLSQDRSLISDRRTSHRTAR
jgi:two-component system copper resistance phosphate regulon response regulator CusR